MTAKLYGFAQSHPTLAVGKMLALKGIDYETVTVPGPVPRFIPDDWLAALAG